MKVMTKRKAMKEAKRILREITRGQRIQKHMTKRLGLTNQQAAKECGGDEYT